MPFACSATPFGERRAQTSDIVDQRFGCELDHARRRAQALGDARLERAEIDPVRVVEEHLQRQAVGIGAEPVAVMSGAKHEVEQPLGAATRRECREQLVGVAPFDLASRPGHGFAHEIADDQIVERVDVGVPRPDPMRSPRAAA